MRRISATILLLLVTACPSNLERTRYYVDDFCREQASMFRFQVDWFAKNGDFSHGYEWGTYFREIQQALYFCGNVRGGGERIAALKQEFREVNVAATGKILRRDRLEALDGLERLVEIFEEMNRYPLR